MATSSELRETLCNVFDFSGKIIGTLQLVGPTRKCYPCFSTETDYYIKDSIGMKDKKGIVLSADSQGFVCNLWEEEVHKSNTLEGRHVEYTVFSNRFDTEEDAVWKMKNLRSMDIVFFEEEKKWGLMRKERVPNLFDGNTFLHVVFNEKSEEKQKFFCRLKCPMTCTPRGYTHVRCFTDK